MVEFSVTVTALHTSMGIAQQNLNTFLTTQLFLITTFHTEFPDVIARLIVVILLNVGG